MEPAALLACVRPRARRADAGAAEPRLLEDLVGALIGSGESGLVWIGGPAGAGKSTALRLLAQRFAGSRAAFLDDPTPQELASQPAALKVYAARAPFHAVHLLRLELLPWDGDDVLELLLARAPERCVALYPALLADPFGKTLGGHPALWSAVVAVCLEEGRADVARALRVALRRSLGPPARRRLAAAAALADLTRDERAFFRIRQVVGLRYGRAPGDPMVLQAAARLLLAADHLALRLRAGRGTRALFQRLPPELVELAGARAGSSQRARELLEGLIDNADARTTAVSLLHAGDPRWLASILDRRKLPPVLEGAHLVGAQVAGAQVAELHARAARLERSDWSGARVERFVASRARFTRASLKGAHFEVFHAPRALFSGADLTDFRSERAKLQGADLTGARALRAHLAGADLSDAILERADFSGALLDAALLEGARVDGLCLAGASLKRAMLCGLDLRRVHLRSAVLAGANLARANLEGVDLPKARLEGAFLVNANLTASRMRGAQLRGARLIGAGLAEIEWEGADLCGADLAEASFHLGSSRSGLVGGYPSQGTRTGFYVDLPLDREAHPPEEVRKANLCSADLRGARVLRTDFYLVDLRGALYTPDQERHFRATGAILGAR